MKRILILGCSGAGKSTLARMLNKHFGFPIIHLDQHYWKPNWVESSKEEWEEKVKELIYGDEWIMDGNYGGTLDLRIPRADTIIFKDASTLTCLYRVTKRIIKYWGKVRPDMTEDCVERFDFEFFHYILMYNFTSKKSLFKKLKTLNEVKRLYIIKDNKELEELLTEI